MPIADEESQRVPFDRITGIRTLEAFGIAPAGRFLQMAVVCDAESGRKVMPMPIWRRVPCGFTVMIKSRPQRVSVWPRRIVIGSAASEGPGRLDGWIVNRIVVGDREAISSPIKLREIVGQEINVGVVQVGMDFAVELTNELPDPDYYAGVVFRLDDDAFQFDNDAHDLIRIDKSDPRLMPLDSPLVVSARYENSLIDSPDPDRVRLAHGLHLEDENNDSASVLTLISGRRPVSSLVIPAPAGW